jgi:inorganic pyrophosphatase
MSSNLYFLPSGKVEKFNVVIEIPEGSQNKYEMDPETGGIFLDRVLYSSEFYPFNYGFIPSTKAEDGDALDVAVLLSNPVYPGTVVPCRAVGMLTKVDDGDQDNCIIAVPVDKIDPRWSEVQDLSEIGEHRKQEITDFFKNYKRLQGKSVNIQEWLDKGQAETEIEKYLNSDSK